MNHVSIQHGIKSTDHIHLFSSSIVINKKKDRFQQDKFGSCKSLVPPWHSKCSSCASKIACFFIFDLAEICMYAWLPSHSHPQPCLPAHIYCKVQMHMYMVNFIWYYEDTKVLHIQILHFYIYPWYLRISRVQNLQYCTGWTTITMC